MRHADPRGSELGNLAVVEVDAVGVEQLRRGGRVALGGIVLAVKRDGVMAQVEMACGPYRIVSLMSREAADELGLEPGSRAEAVIKATGVVVEKR